LNFTDHCWFSDIKIATSTSQGEIHIINSSTYEVTQYIDKGFEMQGLGIINMCPFSKGIMITAEKGYFGCWINNEDPNNI
jgi:hypothetical protein